jgi:hypothetical protein
MIVRRSITASSNHATATIDIFSPEGGETSEVIINASEVGTWRISREMGRTLCEALNATFNPHQTGGN